MYNVAGSLPVKIVFISGTVLELNLNMESVQTIQKFIGQGHGVYTFTGPSSVTAINVMTIERLEY